jgi:hypothetical protein
LSAQSKAIVGRWLADPGGEAMRQWSLRSGIPAGACRGWYCLTCDNYFGRIGEGYRIWHCVVCGGHQSDDRETCGNCHDGERPA